MTSYCQYGQHYTGENSPGTLMVYTDLPNGVKSNTRTCQACYLAHLQKYYPDSFVTQELTRRANKESNNVLLDM